MPSQNPRPERESSEPGGVDLNTIDEPTLPALSRRAALRRQTIGETPLPQTEGPHGGAERAGLIFLGVPEAEVPGTIEKVLGSGGAGSALMKALRALGQLGAKEPEAAAPVAEKALGAGEALQKLVQPGNWLGRSPEVF